MLIKKSKTAFYRHAITSIEHSEQSLSGRKQTFRLVQSERGSAE